ncbi:MAG: hypothetical protein R2881_02840 [Eubacteriales bacterium]
MDERIEGPAPIYDFFQKYNIIPLERLLRLAKESGVKHAVARVRIFRTLPKNGREMELTRWHPYIRHPHRSGEYGIFVCGREF